MTPLQGNWSWKGPKPIQQFDFHTSCTADTTKAGHRFYRGGVGAYVQSEGKTIVLGVTLPGQHSLYYAVVGDRIYWNEYKWGLQKRCRALGVLRPQVRYVEAGELAVFGPKGLKNYAVEKYEAGNIEPVDMETAAVELERRFVRAAQDTIEASGLKDQPVITMLSGGTDSTLVALALQKAGVDQVCLCVGRSEEDFDPKHARRYAEQLGLEYHFVSLPETDEEWTNLAFETVCSIESSEMSNTLMAMCTRQAMKYAKRYFPERKTIFHGHFADDMFGNSNATMGTFRKENPEPTSRGWRDYRAKLYMHIIPNDRQVAQVSRWPGYGMEWRGLFNHPLVWRYLLQLPLGVVRVDAMKKPVLYAILDKYIDGGAWHDSKKVGYYSGAGISKVRMENDILQDANIRKLYAIARKRLT